MPDMNGNSGDQQQQFQDALSQLFGRIQNPNDVTPLLQPGMPGGPPVGPSTVTPQRTRVPFANPVTSQSEMPVSAPAATPRPSNDPAITMPTLPQVPNFRTPDLLNQRLATRTAIDEVNKSHANDARDYKPHWYDRVLGGLTGAVVGGVTGDAKLGAQTGDKITDRRLNAQNRERQRELTPLFQHLSAQKEDQPFYTNADTEAQHEFEDKRQNAVEQRQQITSQEKNEMTQQLNDIKQQVADNKHDEALSRIGEMQKRLDEKTNHDKDWLDMQHSLLDLRRDALDLKEKQGTTKGKANKFDTIQKDKAAAEARADREYNLEMQTISDKKSPEAQAAAATKTEKYRAAQANYEQRIETQGGDPDHIEYDENGVARNNEGTAVGPASSGASAQPGSTPPAPPATGTATVKDATLTKPAKPGSPLTDSKIAKQYLDAAGGDKAKARQLAKKDGWKF